MSDFFATKESETEDPQEELNDKLELLALSDNEFAQGIARMIEFVMSNKPKPAKPILLGGAPSAAGAVAPADLYESITYE